MKNILAVLVLALILSACENPNCGDIIVLSTFPYQANVVVYHLVGHVPWRPDRTIATNLSSVKDAHAKAQLIGCNIK